MITTELATIGNVTQRISASGKMLGQRMTFEGSNTASEIRATLRAAGHKGKALSNATNACLAGEADVRWMRHEALVSAARSNGFVPDFTDVSSKGTGMVTKYVKPDQQAVISSSVVAKDAEIADLRRQLEAALTLMKDATEAMAAE